MAFFKLKLDQLMDSLCRVCLAESKQNLEDEKPVTGASWLGVGPHLARRTWSPSTGVRAGPVLPAALPGGSESPLGTGAPSHTSPGRGAVPFAVSDTGRQSALT